LLKEGQESRLGKSPMPGGGMVRPLRRSLRPHASIQFVATPLRASSRHAPITGLLRISSDLGVRTRFFPVGWQAETVRCEKGTGRGEGNTPETKPPRRTWWQRRRCGRL